VNKFSWLDGVEFNKLWKRYNIAFPRRDEGLLTILLVLEIAQTRIEFGPTASIRYSVPFAALTKAWPGAGMLGCTTRAVQRSILSP
jgi:hypothetical protein